MIFRSCANLFEKIEQAISQQADIFDDWILGMNLEEKFKFSSILFAKGIQRKQTVKQYQLLFKVVAKAGCIAQVRKQAEASSIACRTSK